MLMLIQHNVLIILLVPSIMYKLQPEHNNLHRKLVYFLSVLSQEDGFLGMYRIYLWNAAEHYFSLGNCALMNEKMILNQILFYQD